jgi:hypothetical protein
MSFHRRESSFGPGRSQSKWEKAAKKYYRKGYKYFQRLPLWQKIVLILANIIGLVAVILFFIYNERIFSWLKPVAARWRDLRGGWLIIWAMTFVVAFPPMIGYSTSVTIAGFVYGFPNG